MSIFSKKKGHMFKLIGKSVNSAQLKAFTSQFDTEPEVEAYDEYYFHSYRNSGVELGFNLKDRLVSISLYADGHMKISGFMGDLPYGLSLSDMRLSVEKKLGKAPETGGKGTWRFWMRYPRLGVSINYKSTSTTDLFNKIAYITLS